MIQSQADAKRFFAQKAIEQAAAEGVPLTPAEREMLFWSESDPGFETRAASEALAAEMSDEQYESKISGLLARSFSAAVAADPGAADVWQQARAVLDQGDHYLSSMLEGAVGSRMKRWWQVWR